ncbi:HesA/MoeB/ThiF family protein [Pollutibacter soli]|uniref:HesA/MoeB/ThiF family protein n=1 Tax=Pollutibacter soli TaxID=3034157 RepID=UPI0030133FAA
MSKSFSPERYQRQLILDKFGMAAQQKLSESRVLVIGAGGLGCPVLSYLVAAGVGNIGIVDDDVIAIHNLHRQPLYDTKDVGKLKALTAREHLLDLNPSVHIEAITSRLDESNALSLFARFDIIVDGSDNFATRYLVNDAAVLTGKPFVYGAVTQYEGQLAVFNVTSGQEVQGIHYRDLFPEPPAPGKILNCAEAGVIGVLPGIIGIMMAAEVIKFISGVGKMLTGKLLTLNILTNQWLELELVSSEKTRSLIPKDAESFARMRYEDLCNGNSYGISVNELKKMLADESILIVDVREVDEVPEMEDLKTLRIPMSIFKEKMSGIPVGKVAFICQSGIRSRRAAEMLADARHSGEGIFSVNGGVVKWMDSQNKAAHV